MSIRYANQNCHGADAKCLSDEIRSIAEVHVNATGQICSLYCIRHRGGWRICTDKGYVLITKEHISYDVGDVAFNLHYVREEESYIMFPVPSCPRQLRRKLPLIAVPPRSRPFLRENSWRCRKIDLYLFFPFCSKVI